MKHESSLKHVILGEGIYVDSSKIQDVLTWNTSAHVINSRNSLGLVGYYQKIIKGFSKTMKPMIELLGRTRSSSGHCLWS
jgi:hypothetical protein